MERYHRQAESQFDAVWRHLKERMLQVGEEPVPLVAQTGRGASVEYQSRFPYLLSRLLPDWSLEARQELHDRIIEQALGKWI